MKNNPLYDRIFVDENGNWWFKYALIGGREEAKKLIIEIEDKLCDTFDEDEG